MTFVGKILVLVIMVFSLLFLAFSAVVFTTEKNWKQAHEDLTKTLNETKSAVSTAQNEKAKVEQDLATAQQAAAQDAKLLQAQVDNLQGEINTRQNEITAQRTAVEKAIESVRNAQDDAAARFAETTKAREELAALEEVANQLKIQEQDLLDKIRLLDRDLDTAKTNNEELRENNLAFRNKLRDLNVNPESVATEARYPDVPEVDGEILQVDPSNRMFVISLGSDDELLVGHKLKVYRLGAQAAYLGEVRVTSLNEDQAVVTLIGNTPQGQKIKEGDIVATTIRPRG